MAGRAVLSVRPSFKDRFLAWWDGYALPDGSVAMPAARAGAGARTEPAAGKTRARFAAPDNGPLWSKPRRDLAGQIFGPGFVAPSHDYLVELARPFGPTSAMSILEIGSGAGGGACAIAQLWGAYVDGFDRNPDLVAEGSGLATVLSVDDRVKMHAFDAGSLAGLKLKNRFYDGAIMHDVLPYVADKAALVAKAAAAIKPGATLVLSDLFLGDGASATDWRSAEPEPTEPCDVAHISDRLAAAGFDVRKTKDVTEEYCREICHCWDGFVRDVDRARLAPEMVLPLVGEIERWARRSAAMDDGALRMVQITAIRPGDAPR